MPKTSDTYAFGQRNAANWIDTHSANNREVFLAREQALYVPYPNSNDKTTLSHPEAVTGLDKGKAIPSEF